MKIILLFAFPLALTACDSDRSGAKKAVLAVLKDPDSARFGDFYFNPKTKKGCLTVNAKNSMGGYTGEQQAYVRKTETGWESYGAVEISPETCRSNIADKGD